MTDNSIKENKKETRKEKKVREPLFHVSKRGDISPLRSVSIRAIAIVLSLIVGGIIAFLVTKDNPISLYLTMIDGAFGGKHRIMFTLQQIAMLLCVSLAVTPAFKMKFWNIGAEGQVLIGCLATAICMYTLGDIMPTWLLIATMAVASIAAGILWGVIPAIFKANFGTNETLFTLMMNYVAIQLVECFLKIAGRDTSNTVGPNLLSHGWLPTLFGQQYLLNIVIVALLTVAMYIYLKYTKHGYEISVVGESENTARYVGINVKKVIIRTMALSGAICGLVGLLLVGGTSHSIDSGLADNRGFTAVMVSWLAKFNPLYMVLTSLLLVFMDRGAEEIASKFRLNSSFADILTGIILFFIIGSEFFIRYEIKINKNHRFFNKSKEVAKV